jgi:hypothetical protein
MTTSDTTKTTDASLARDLLHAARYYLSGRRGLLILAVVALIGGAALNWGWLVAVGIAPVLLTVLPCLVMCGLGLCMNKLIGGSNTSQESPVSQLTDNSSASTEATTASAAPLRSCCQGGDDASLPGKPAENSNAR